MKIHFSNENNLVKYPASSVKMAKNKLIKKRSSDRSSWMVKFNRKFDQKLFKAVHSCGCNGIMMSVLTFVNELTENRYE